MARQITVFSALALILGLLFWLPRSDWRSHGWNYISAYLEKNLAQVASSGEGRIPPNDTTRLEELYDLIAESELLSRLDRLADSLLVLRRELAGYHDILLAVRETARSASRGVDEDFTTRYFSAARFMSRLENEAERLAAQMDSLRDGLEAVGRIRDYIETRDSRVYEIRWLRPERVPVRELCTSCHLLLNGGERVMLFPEATPESYPGVMAFHPPREFGCTVCHNGAPGELDFNPAHGTDHLGRPFRPGKLALRSCGLCHAERSPLRFAAVPFSWPKSCVQCHENDRLAALVDSSAMPALQYPLDTRRFRSWVLRHWSEKEGRVPERDSFEEVVAVLVSGDLRPHLSKADTAFITTRKNGQQKVIIMRCPSCGRIFTAAGASVEFVCPVDGSALETVIEK